MTVLKANFNEHNAKISLIKATATNTLGIEPCCNQVSGAYP